MVIRGNVSNSFVHYRGADDDGTCSGGTMLYAGLQVSNMSVNVMR